MKKVILIISIVLVSQIFLFAQEKEQTLITINDRIVTVSEFERIYKKNNNLNTVDQKSIEEYLELFINFKLKVLEAERLKLDTAQAFINELSGYRNQLAKPYLTDKDADEKILLEAYERMQSDIRASHILIKVDENAQPKDTLFAYNKALKARKRIIDGEDIAKVASEISDDPSAKNNGGDLGFFTAFQMVYPFESAAYKLSVGDVSNPVRTRFGYHIIKLNDKRENQGQIKVAHIMIAISKEADKETIDNAKKRIDEVFSKLKAGEDFIELAKLYSDDKGSAKQGGELPWFGTGRMVPEFEIAAFELKNKEDFSEPVLTSFGWHLIKLIDKKPLGKYEDLKAEIKNKIARDARSEESKKSFIANLKKEYKFNKNQKNIDELFKLVDKSFLEGKWEAEKALNLNKQIFAFADQAVLQSDFAKYLNESQKKVVETDLRAGLNKKLEDFIDKKVIEYEDGKLESKYPEFRYLMNEYHDGILLFELTDKMVWTKAVQDTLGLQNFHEQNKAKYMWDKRVDASIYRCPDEKIAEGVKKIAKKRIAKGYSYDETLLKIIKVTKNDETKKVTVEDGKFLKGDNDLIDKVDWNVQISENFNINNKVVFVAINKIIEPTPKSLKESKGLVTADYQAFLEAEWIKELRSKYNVVVNKDALSNIK